MKLKHLTGGLLLLPVAAILFAGAPKPAEAEPPFGIHGRGHGGGPPGAQKFGHGGFCPPGLRDKGCVPPGLQFGRGDYIPDHVPYDRIRYDEFGLRRPPDGHRYVRIGDDAYLITEGTRRVIEAISLLGAVGR